MPDKKWQTEKKPSISDANHKIANHKWSSESNFVENSIFSRSLVDFADNIRK